MQIQQLCWLSFSIRCLQETSGYREEDFFNKTKHVTKGGEEERGTKVQGKVCNTECEAVSPSLSAPLTLPMTCPCSTPPTRLQTCPFFQHNDKGESYVLSPWYTADIRPKMCSILQQIHV